jgi:hypothetical protein
VRVYASPPNQAGWLSRGAITAEWAITMPAVGLVLAIVLGGIGMSIDRGRLHQAAADGQRVLSYGGTPADVTAYVYRTLRSTNAIITIGAGPGEGLGCVTVKRENTQWLAGLLTIDRESTSCGLVIPR